MHCKFYHDDYALEFTMMHEECYKHNLGRERMTIDKVCKYHPCILHDKSLYNVDTLIEAHKLKKSLITFDPKLIDKEYIKNVLMHIIKNTLTQDVIDDANKMLLQVYDKHNEKYARNKELIQNIKEKFQDDEEHYNTIRVFLMVDEKCDYSNLPLFIYIEKGHDVNYYLFDDGNNDRNVHSITTENLLDDVDVRYGYGVKDVFKLPHYVEVDGVEYQRIDIRDTYPVRNEEAIFIFTTGKMLCIVNYHFEM